jgi:hypothetical protein
MARRSLILLLAALPALAQPARIATDPRIELLSIVFHLAGNNEYNQCHLPPYCADVDQYFAPFKDDETVRLARELNETRGINYDAVMTFAIYIKDVDSLAERVPFDGPHISLKERWRTEDAQRFAASLRGFVARTKFRQFLDNHAAIYETTTTRLRKLVDSQADLSWFDKFFGAKPDARFIIIPGLVNGGANYGPHLQAEDSREEMYAILGVWQVDSEKLPLFDKNYVPNLVHEFTHSYVNPLVDRFPALDKAAYAAMKPVEADMRQQAYSTGHIVACESLVRASTARYIFAHDGAAAGRADVAYELNRAFFWTGELSDLLGTYETDREHYPTLESFMPKVVAYFEKLPPHVPELVKDFDAKRPKLVSMTPANGLHDVDPGTTKVVMKFDRPLRGGFSFCYTDRTLYPKFGQMAYDDAKTTFNIDVQFEPNRDYEFRFNCNSGFVAQDGMPVKPETVKWHTRAAP